MWLEMHPMTLHTAEAVARLEETCFSDPWSLESLLYEVVNPSAYYLTACENSEIVGYIGLRHVLDEGHITNVAVAPSHRRKGIAKALIQGIIAYARERRLAFLTLEVREGNEPAVLLYRNLGFEPVGKRRSYYRHPAEDALLMTLFLAGK